MTAAYMLARLVLCLTAQKIPKLILFAQFSHVSSEGQDERSIEDYMD